MARATMTTLRALVAKTPTIDAGTLYDCLTIEDVRMAAEFCARLMISAAAATDS